MKKLRKIIEIDEELCDGCGQCVPDCAEGSLIIENGKAKLVADKLCDGLGACLGSCPRGALKIIEKVTDDFDEEAVEEYLAEKAKSRQTTATIPMGGGCPSSHIETFTPQQPGTSRVSSGSDHSFLAQWPIQIRLIPPTAPFLKNSDLLVVADCTAVAAPHFQEKYVPGKTVMMGCPKFDDIEDYISRFTEIIQIADLQSITILIAEVPCCSGMVGIIKKAMESAGKSVPVEQITLSRRGEEIGRISW